MRKALGFIVLVAAMLATSAYFLYDASTGTARVYQTVRPFRATISRTIVATGTIGPRTEVKLKPQISGVVERLLVERGAPVTAGQLVAAVQPLPDPVDVSAAEAELRAARIRLAHVRGEFDRNRNLFQRSMVSATAFNQFRLDLRLARAAVAAAARNLEIVQTGASVELGRSASEVRATIAGMVLDRPVEIGAFVIETNEFNEGTTIMTLADMADLIFKGQVDEPDAGRLQVGMPLTLTIGAFPRERFRGRLELIAPKATKGKDGITQFEIRAALKREPGRFVRAGYSATAKIIVARREGVLAVREQDLGFRRGDPYVRVETRPGVFKPRTLTLGISDGINTEVVAGLRGNERIRAN